jgi:hypothetical protein
MRYNTFLKDLFEKLLVLSLTASDFQKFVCCVIIEIISV